MTAEERRVRSAIRAWVQKHKRTRVLDVRHVFTRAYVLARPAAKCVVIVHPWVDAEIQVRDQVRAHGSTACTLFDDSLHAGDWCSLAYVVTKQYGQHVAIPLEPRRREERVSLGRAQQ